jgi:hypothetical protein
LWDRPDPETDGIGFTIQQKAEIVVFVFDDELTAARHVRALEDAIAAGPKNSMIIPANL